MQYDPGSKCKSHIHEQAVLVMRSRVRPRERPLPCRALPLRCQTASTRIDGRHVVLPTHSFVRSVMLILPVISWIVFLLLNSLDLFTCTLTERIDHQGKDVNKVRTLRIRILYSHFQLTSLL